MTYAAWRTVASCPARHSAPGKCSCPSGCAGCSAASAWTWSSSPSASGASWWGRTRRPSPDTCRLSAEYRCGTRRSPAEGQESAIYRNSYISQNDLVILKKKKKVSVLNATYQAERCKQKNNSNRVTRAFDSIKFPIRRKARSVRQETLHLLFIQRARSTHEKNKKKGEKKTTDRCANNAIVVSDWISMQNSFGIAGKPYDIQYPLPKHDGTSKCTPFH